MVRLREDERYLSMATLIFAASLTIRVELRVEDDSD